MAGFHRPWFVAGGWAIDLFLERETRPHRDIEIAVFREDQTALRDYLRGWRWEKAVRGSGGRLEAWAEGEWLEPPLHEVHGRAEGPGSLRELEVLLNEREGDDWLYRRNPAVRRPIARMGLRSRQGVPYLAPEVVLLYKAPGTRPEDEADFRITLPRLEEERRRWLRGAIETCYPEHPWLEALGG